MKKSVLWAEMIQEQKGSGQFQNNWHPHQKELFAAFQ